MNKSIIPIKNIKAPIPIFNKRITQVTYDTTSIPEEHREACRSFSGNGYWLEGVFMYVDIASIELPDVWSNLKYERNCNRIQSSGRMPPVVLSLDKDSGKYVLSDGRWAPISEMIHNFGAGKTTLFQ